MEKIYDEIIHFAYDYKRKIEYEEKMLIMKKYVRLLLSLMLMLLMDGGWKVNAELVGTETTSTTSMGAGFQTWQTVNQVRFLGYLGVMPFGFDWARVYVTPGDYREIPGGTWPIGSNLSRGLTYPASWNQNGQMVEVSIYNPSVPEEILRDFIMITSPQKTWVSQPLPFQPQERLLIQYERVSAWGQIIRIFRDGELLEESPIHSGSGPNGAYGIGFDRRRFTGNLYKPIVTHAPNLERWIGQAFDPFAGITATWGYSQHLTIPTHGDISIQHWYQSELDRMSDGGTTYAAVGEYELYYEVRDDHSLSNSGIHIYDQTMTLVPRNIVVKTTASPTLNIHYATSALAPDGATSITGLPYDPMFAGVLPCGGEQGWTREEVAITASPGAITGSFQTVTSINNMNIAKGLNTGVFTDDFFWQSETVAGMSISAYLIDAFSETHTLTPTVTSTLKQDLSDPIPALSHEGNWNFTDLSSDALSGLSVTRPTLMAFSSNISSFIPPTSGWEEVGLHSFNETGVFDVWVWATDKAGNERKVKAFSALPFSEREVTISKDSDRGATLHIHDCSFATLPALDASCPSCTLGLNVDIDEKSELTYILTLTNTDTLDNAVGSFEDYLPLGTTIPPISPNPTATPSSAISNTNIQLVTGGPYDGQYKVTGDFSLGPGESIDIRIVTKAPAFDEVVAANNVIRNQASITWTIGSLGGSNVSNYAVHELLEVLGVEAKFTKVGADALNTGLAGAEFALYRWDGALPPTQAEQKHMVDTTMLVDNTLAGGDWVRATYDGEDAASITDVFLSATAPLGEVDLGHLPDGFYTLIETKAPTGYELPVGQWLLEIDITKNDTGASDWKIEFTGKSHTMMPPAAVRDAGPTYKIINAKPFMIGMSGLGGTASLLLAGFVLMAVAGNAYAAYSYKQNKKTKK